MVGDFLAHIKCPICDQEVEAADEMGLSRDFRIHLSEKHKMTELADLGPDERMRMQSMRSISESRPMPEPGEMTGTTGSLGITQKKAHFILCPFCNEEIRGESAESLGDNLKRHWIDTHQLRPTIAAELGLKR